MPWTAQSSPEFPARYGVVLSKNEDGYAVECPSLPGCWSQGATEQEALENIRCAIKEYLAAAEELRKPY